MNSYLLSFTPVAFLLQTQPGTNPEQASALSEFFVNPFVIAILFFFLLGFVRVVRYLLTLPKQTSALKRVNENFVEVERSQESDSELIKQDLLRDVPLDSIVARRVVELQRIGVRGGDFDQLALAEVLAAREGAKVSIARYVASVLVLLGLCGAIWGLSHLVFKMSPALQQVQEQLDKGSATERPAEGSSVPTNGTAPVQESFKTLISIMSDSLKNTRSAFYASLSGILSSVVLLLLNWFVSWRQVSFLAEVEYLTATKLIPIFKPPPEATQLAEVVGAFREGSDYLVKLSKGLDDREAEVGSHLVGLFGIMQKFREGADALEGQQTRATEAQNQLINVVNDFVTLTSRIEANQAGAHGDLAGLVAAVNESNKNLARALEDWQSQREDMLQSIDRVAKQAHAETKQSQELVSQGLNEVAVLIRTSVDQQVTMLRTGAIDLLKEQQEGVREQISELVNRQGEFVAQLQKSVVESAGHKELLAGLTSTIESERTTFTDGMNRILQTNEKVLTALMADQKQLLDISGMRKVEERLEIFMRESHERFNALMERHSAVGQQFSQLGSLADRLGGMLRLLIGISAVTIPVFAALGIMYIFDFRPADLTMRIVSMLMIVAMIFGVAWLLKAKS